MVKLFSKRAQFSLKNWLHRSVGEATGISTKYRVEDAERRQKQIDSLHEEALQLKQDLADKKTKRAEIQSRITLELVPLLATPEAPVAGNAINAANMEMVQLDNEMKELEGQGKEINEELGKLGASPITGLHIALGLPPGSLGKIFKVILVLILIFIGVWYFTFNPTGTLVSSQAGSAFTIFKDAFHTSVVPADARLGFNILAGKQDATVLWDSKVYKDRYSVVTDAGVEISDLRALRDPFIEGSQLSIVGTIKAVSLPEDPGAKTPEGITAKINAEWSSGEFSSFVAEALGISAWDCNPPIDDDKTKEITNQERFVGRFECQFPGFKIDKAFESQSVDVTVGYNFKVVGGKTTYVASFSDLSRLFLEDKDPATEYGISNAEITTWHTKSPVEIGIGVLGEKDVIGANNPTDNPTPYFMGFTISNKGEGEASLSELHIKVPQNVNFLPGTDNDFTPDPSTGNNCNEQLGTIKLCAYKANIKEQIRRTYDRDELKAGETATVFFKFEVPQDTFLGESPLSSFFVLADVPYNYEVVRSVPVNIRKAP